MSGGLVAFRRNVDFDGDLGSFGDLHLGVGDDGEDWFLGRGGNNLDWRESRCFGVHDFDCRRRRLMSMRSFDSEGEKTLTLLGRCRCDVSRRPSLDDRLHCKLSSPSVPEEQSIEPMKLTFWVRRHILDVLDHSTRGLDDDRLSWQAIDLLRDGGEFRR